MRLHRLAACAIAAAVAFAAPAVAQVNLGEGLTIQRVTPLTSATQRIELRVDGIPALVIYSNPNGEITGFAHPDGAANGLPVFRMDERFDRPKVEFRSAIIAEWGDTPEIAFVWANGTPTSPTVRTGPYPGFYLYGVPRDTTGATFLNNPFPHAGRVAQIYMPQVETPTPTARGGALVFGSTPRGKVTPIDRFYLSPEGNLVVLGAAAFEATGQTYPWTFNVGVDGFAGSNNRGPQRWDNYAGNGALTILSTPNQRALSIRDWQNPNANGFDLRWNHTLQRAEVATRVGGVETITPLVGTGSPPPPASSSASGGAIPGGPSLMIRCEFTLDYPSIGGNASATLTTACPGILAGDSVIVTRISESQPNIDIEGVANNGTISVWARNNGTSSTNPGALSFRAVVMRW